MTNPNASQFTHCPCCGDPSLVPDTCKSFSCRSCGFVFFINCAAAVMAVILDDKGRLLVTQRKEDPTKGSLDLPGGFTEPGEGVEESLIREIKEELNLEITFLSYLCSFPNTYRYKSVAYPITDMAFVCQVDNFDTIRAMDDISDFSFVPFNGIDLNLFGLDSPKQVIQYYLKSRQH